MNKRREEIVTDRRIKSIMASAHSPLPAGKKVIVLGAGISGISAAIRLGELAPKTALTVWEKSDRVGGVLQTVERNGLQFERSADNFITFVPWGLQFCAKLGLTDHLVRTNNQDRRTYVARRGKLHPLPDGFMMLAPTKLWPMVTTPLLSPFGKLRAGLELLIPRLKGGDDETIAAFARRRLGREVFDRIVEPLLSGIYAGDAEKISLMATLPRFREMEKKDRSLIIAMTKGARTAQKIKREEESGARYGMFVTLREGLSFLAQKGADSLPSGTFQFGRTAVRLDRVQDETGIRRWRVTDSRGESETADGVICALPSAAAGPLFADSVPKVASFYDGMEQTGCAVVTFAFQKGQIKKDFKGMGFVVPTKEGGTIVAGSFSSHKYPHRAPEGISLIRVFVGGARAPERVELPEDRLEKEVLEEVRPLLGARGTPTFADAAKWPRGMPQYHLGHLERLAALNALLAREPTLALCGNSFTGVGIPNCIKSGEDAAEKIGAFLNQDGVKKDHFE